MKHSLGRSNQLSAGKRHDETSLLVLQVVFIGVSAVSAVSLAHVHITVFSAVPPAHCVYFIIWPLQDVFNMLVLLYNLLGV